MRDRRFGVELEFDSDGLGWEGTIRALRSGFDRAGERHWNFSSRLHSDGSEFELATPILYGRDGFRKLKLVMDTLRDAGCYCTGEDGMHVHHDAPEFVDNIDNCVKIVKSWKRNSHLIYRFVADWRWEDAWANSQDENANYYWACPGWSDEEIELMERERTVPNWERHDLNLTNLPYRGTIEFRNHEGTLDYSEAEAWVLFGQRFIDRTLAHSMYDSGNVDKLLKKVKISPSAEKKLLDKAGFRRR